MKLSKRRTRPFTQIDNQPLNEKMSFQSKGLLSYLLSKPDNWTINTKQLISQSGEKETKSGKVIPKNGRDSIRSMFAELVEFGYARIENCKDDTGRFSGKRYRITEVPFQFDDEEFAEDGNSVHGIGTEDGKTEDGKTEDGKTEDGKTEDGNSNYIVIKNSSNKEYSNTHSHTRKIQRTESGSIDPRCLKPAKEAPPVPAAPPEDLDEFELLDKAVAELTRKATVSQHRLEVFNMSSKHKRTMEQAKEEASVFAKWYMGKKIDEGWDAIRIANHFIAMRPSEAQAKYNASFWNKPYSQYQNNESTRNNKPKHRETREEAMARLGILGAPTL